jgi:hypothetical protein
MFQCLNGPATLNKNLLHRQRRRSSSGHRLRSLGAGLVSHMPSGPGVISDELIAEIAATVPPAIGTFLLTSRHKCCRHRRATTLLPDEYDPALRPSDSTEHIAI